MAEPSTSGKTGEGASAAKGVEPQPTASNLPGLEDEGLESIFGPEPTSDDSKTGVSADAGTDEKLKTSQAEPVTEPSEEKPKYTLGEIEFTEEDIARWKQLEESQDPANVKKLEGKHHKRGLELNQQEQALNDREATLKSRETEMEKVRDLAEEYRQVKELVNQDPAFAKTLKDRLANPKSYAQVEIAKFKEELREENETTKKDSALIRLQKDLPNFSEDTCKETYESFNFDDPYDLYRALHFIGLGLHLEDEVTKRLATANKETAGEPTLPPVSGASRPVKSQVYKTVDEAAEAYLKELGLS